MANKRSDIPPVPTESVEQQCVFHWAAWARGQWPELNLLYHVPNGGYRNPSEAARFRAEGVKAGVPDLCLPVSRAGYHGLYIELKRKRGGKVSAEQNIWLDRLAQQGYRTAAYRSADEAIREINAYLRETCPKEAAPCDAHD